MKTTTAFATLSLALSCASSAYADTFGTDPNTTFEIEFVTIGKQQRPDRRERPLWFPRRKYPRAHHLHPSPSRTLLGNEQTPMKRQPGPQDVTAAHLIAYTWVATAVVTIGFTYRRGLPVLNAFGWIAS